MDRTAHTGARVRATRTDNQRKLAAAVADSKVSYEDIQSVLYGLLGNLDINEWSMDAREHPSFIEGRCAAVRLAGSDVGTVGEISPEVLIRFGLENPVAAFEINLEECFFSRVEPKTGQVKAGT